MLFSTLLCIVKYENNANQFMYYFALYTLQWVKCDLRNFDMTVLGKFAVIMADPPWDIHMELPYGTMADDEMRSLNIPTLQDDGYIFLWVTGRYAFSVHCTVLSAPSVGS